MLFVSDIVRVEIDVVINTLSGVGSDAAKKTLCSSVVASSVVASSVATSSVVVSAVDKKLSLKVLSSDFIGALVLICKLLVHESLPNT